LVVRRRRDDSTLNPINSTGTGVVTRHHSFMTPVSRPTLSDTVIVHVLQGEDEVPDPAVGHVEADVEIDDLEALGDHE